jgi:hypothetical protein
MGLIYKKSLDSEYNVITSHFYCKNKTSNFYGVNVWMIVKKKSIVSLHRFKWFDKVLQYLCNTLNLTSSVVKHY